MFSAFFGAALSFAVMFAGDAAASAARSIKIGLVDLAIDRSAFADIPNVTVRTMSFWTSGTKEARKQDTQRRRSHGEDMVRSVVDGVRAIDPETPIEIYVATPFRADAKTGALTLDFNDLNVAWNWFKTQDVKIVAETFVGPDSDNQRDAVRRAQELGLIVLASAGNGPSHNVVPPFPASYDGVISISTTELVTELTRERDRNEYVDFSVAPKSFSTISFRNDPELASLLGSSAATATAAGVLGALSARTTVQTRDDAVRVLSCVMQPSERFASGRAWGAGVLVPREIGARLRTRGPQAHPCNEAA